MFYTRFNMVTDGDEWADKKIRLVHSYNGYETRLTNDDAIFVAYANKIFVHAADNDVEKKQMIEGENVLKSLRERLYSNQAHYEKYLWLKKYYTETLEDLKTISDEMGEKKKRQYYNDLHVRACYM
jgi:hypothetical protein